ncbi:TetR/AcrR family transcriptional regulator [Saccharopolyspora sp. CA-218241]|uniref:TetR/AcrR family transcriptional regulator n=1 Tax=Saccharopolyspora sp. CA-218241 TaxID=3240027 RepID=UPI003D993281
MPKIVDHEARRRAIVDVVWRLIAAEGLDAVTTRRIAEEAGFANGTLLYYFPTKDAVLDAAFRHVVEATDARADAADPDRRGLDGLRTLCLEILPLDAERLAEARLAVTFWQQALHSASRAALHTRSTDRWRAELAARLAEARQDGTLRADVDPGTTADELLSALVGLQVLAVLSPAQTTPDRQLAQLDALLTRLRAP